MKGRYRVLDDKHAEFTITQRAVKKSEDGRDLSSKVPPWMRNTWPPAPDVAKVRIDMESKDKLRVGNADGVGFGYFERVSDK